MIDCLRECLKKFNNHKKRMMTGSGEGTLTDIKLDNTVEFTLSDKKMISRITEVIDSNTIKVVCSFHGVYIWVICKLDGICCANSKSEIQEEIDLSTECVLFLKSILIEREFEIKFNSMDRFGKYIVEIDIQNESEDGGTTAIKDILIEKNYAYEYKGGKKLQFNQWNLP